VRSRRAAADHPRAGPGYLWACSGMRTRSSRRIPSSSASLRGRRRTCRGASVMFSRIVRCGNRLKDWKTMPVSRRISWMSLRSSDSSVPSTMMRPRSCCSRRLMQRISVDLPDPEGPATTTVSWRPTTRSTPVERLEVPVPLLDPGDLDHDLAGAAGLERLAAQRRERSGCSSSSTASSCDFAAGAFSVDRPRGGPRGAGSPSTASSWRPSTRSRRTPMTR
jgi:hypothetical protein